MMRAVFMAALAALLPLEGASARVVVGNTYSCDVRDVDGRQKATLSVAIRRTQDMPDARLFDAKALPLWVVAKATGGFIPEFDIPTSEIALTSGQFLANIRLGPAEGLPPIAPTVGIRLVLDGDEPVNNGYVVVYRQQVGPVFETLGMGPQAIGLCRLVQSGASQ